MWEEEINRIKGGKGEKRKGGESREEKRKGGENEIPQRLKQCCLLNISLNACSFFCTLIASWQVGLAVSRPCLLQALI